jgi:uncharacterized protein YcbK (DUF882 family)
MYVLIVLRNGRKKMRLKYFKRDEFACKCCGVELMNDFFLYTIDFIRELYGYPIFINSGYRCEKRNDEVMGSPDSSHLKGLAADLRVKSSTERFGIIHSSIHAGIKRIGIGETYIHIDNDSDKVQNVMWLY